MKRSGPCSWLLTARRAEEYRAALGGHELDAATRLQGATLSRIVDHRLESEQALAAWGQCEVPSLRVTLSSTYAHYASWAHHRALHLESDRRAAQAEVDEASQRLRVAIARCRAIDTVAERHRNRERLAASKAAMKDLDDQWLSRWATQRSVRADHED